MNKIHIAIAASVALSLSAGAGASSISLAGLDVEPSLGPTVVTFDNPYGSAVSSLSFDLTYVPTPPSWAEELVIQITHVPSGASLRAGALAPGAPPSGFADHCEFVFGASCDIELGAPLGSSSALVVMGLTAGFVVADGSGLWEVLIAEGFDDAAVIDGTFADDSRITINAGAPIPLPAAGWLLAGGIAGLAGLRRRRG